MKALKTILAATGLTAAIVGVTLAMPAQTRPQPASAAQPFDHSQCQYPDRTTNPVDGCDNSDPCDPASAAKGGSGDCLPQPTTQEPQITPATPVETSKPVNQCGGK